MDKGYNQPGAWAVIYCATTGKFLMGKRSAKVNKAGAWNLFGGRIDNGERPRQALVRELGEEAGLNIKPQHLAKLRKADLPVNVQAVNTNRGSRTRVRVGPFNTLKAADKAAVSVRALALEADVIRQ